MLNRDFKYFIVVRQFSPTATRMLWCAIGEQGSVAAAARLYHESDCSWLYVMQRLFELNAATVFSAASTFSI